MPVEKKNEVFFLHGHRWGRWVEGHRRAQSTGRWVDRAQSGAYGYNVWMMRGVRGV
jgi:hypothetical protein